MTSREHALVKDAFDRQAAGRAASRFHQDEVRARRLVHFADVPHGASVLDVGCGAGPLLAHLGRQGAHAVGLDLSRAMLEHAATTRAPVVQGAVESLPFRAGAFDLVLCRATLHHVPAPDAAVWEMRRVLPDGGVLVLEDALTHVDPVKARAHNQVEKQRDPAHQRMLNVSALTALLEEAGFDVAAVEVVTHEREVDEWMDSALTPPEARASLVKRFEEDEASGTLGLRTRRVDGRLVFDLRHAMVKGVKAG